MGGGPHEPMKLVIILPGDEPKEIIEQLRKDHKNLTVEFYPMDSDKKLPEDVYKDADYLFTLATVPEDPKKQAPKLKWVHFYSAGINQVVGKPIWTDTDITLTTSSGVHGPQISEWIVMTLLNAQHFYLPLHDLQKQHKWDHSSLRDELMSSRDSVGQRIGILGYGSIGRQAARVCQAMGMDVLAYTASPRDSQEAKKDHDYYVKGTGDPDGTIPSAWYSGLDRESLHNFLKQDLDFLVVAVPLTPDTEHFLDATCFDILSARKTFISNISRGKIINQPDLIAALRAGKLRGAALDVTDPEPLPADHELWDVPNVIITPHISGIGKVYTSRSFDILDINLKKREGGEKMMNVVDRKKGY